jgi:hypothetical protein
MIKDSTTSGENWIIVDNKREGASAPTKVLYPNTNGNEESYTVINFTSNGFTVGDTGLANTSGATIIYMAIAEEVFVPDNFFNDDSTVATYKLDGNAGDDSGNGYNGVASNVTYAAGKFDEAGVFNGSSSKVDLQSNLMVSNKSAVTISAWVYFNNKNTQNFIIYNDQSIAGSNRDFGIYDFGNGNIYFQPDGTTDNNRGYVSSSSILPASIWHHIVMVFDGSATGNSNRLKAYVNNSQVTLTYDGTIPSTTGNISTNIWIGARNNSVSFTGSIDQVRIFNRVLDAGEVTQLYNE